MCLDSGGNCGHGRIERGIVKVNDEVEIRGAEATVKTVFTVEMFRKFWTRAGGR